MSVNNDVPHQSTPFIINSEVNSSLIEYYRTHINSVASVLEEYGAVLFRGFDINNLIDFDAFIDIVLKELVNYVGAATPRKVLTAKVATSTEYPSSNEISLHNELSYEHKKPDKLLFGCITPPTEGGQTHLANVNSVYHRIRPDIIAEFEKRGGWMLVRNFGRGFGPTIEQGFGTKDIESIKADCEQRDIDVEIIGTDCIRTKQTRKAVHSHPVNQMPLWMNHVAFWHSSSLPKEQYEVLSQLFAPEELPYATLFGDGTVIPDDYILNIRQAYQR